MKFDISELQNAVKSVTGKLEEGLSEKSLRKVGFAGAAVFRDEAKLNAQKGGDKFPLIRSGNLINNIIAKRLEEQSGPNAQYYVVLVRHGAKDRDGAFYWRFLEYGHRFVPRNPNKGKKANWKKQRAEAALEYGTASAPARPFMRPAFESKKQEALAAMQTALAEVLSNPSDKT